MSPWLSHCRRYNPDTYKPAGLAHAQVKGKKRLEHLVQWVRWAIDNGPLEGDVVSALYLFYDNFAVETPRWESVLRADTETEADA